MRISDWSSDVCASVLLQVVERREERVVGFLVGLLRGGEAGFVDAVVDAPVDRLVDGVDTAAQVLRIEVEAGAGDGHESRVEHADDLSRLVAYKSEKRRVGKAGVSRGNSRWEPDHKKK